MAIGIGLGVAVLVIALALWPRPSGISGTISASVCNPGAGTSGSCAPRPVAAPVRITDCYSGILTSNNPRDNATWETRSDAHGRYHIDLEPGMYCVFAVKESTDPFPPTASREYVAVRAGEVTKVDLLLGYPMGIGLCLGAQDTIATPSGHVVVSQLHAGMIVWTLDAAGHRVAAPVQLVTHTPAPANHRVVRLMLADGRLVEASPEHPTADGRRVGGLRVGDTLDGSPIVGVDRVPYVGDTWDLLPTGPTGVYWAGDIPLKSTLLEVPKTLP